LLHFNRFVVKKLLDVFINHFCVFFHSLLLHSVLIFSSLKQGK
jgi:hypothetical protein